MFVNLCPTLESAHVSTCNLRFARRVNQVKLGKTLKQISSSSSICSVLIVRKHCMHDNKRKDNDGGDHVTIEGVICRLRSDSKVIDGNMTRATKYENAMCSEFDMDARQRITSSSSNVRDIYIAGVCDRITATANDFCISSAPRLKMKI